MTKEISPSLNPNSNPKSVRVEPGRDTGQLPASIEASLNARLNFTPVPRQTKRWNGLTPLKQETFIQNLADSGSVTMAAKSIGTSTSAMYNLRRGEGAESFAAAWEAAIEIGARRVLDTLIEHAIHGTPETIFQGGEIVAERRRFNHRAMMWIVSQRFPEQYGSATGLMDLNGMSHAMRKLKSKWEGEWQAAYEAAQSAEALAKAESDEIERRNVVPAVLVRLYQAKVCDERRYRLNGQTLHADHAARSLTHLELYMEFGGLVAPEITAFFDTANEAPHPWETEASKAIEAHRHAVWAKDEKELGIMRPRPVRHSLGEGGKLMGGGQRGGPTSSERTKARVQAEQQMAEAQRLWEACATEEAWASHLNRSP